MNILKPYEDDIRWALNALGQKRAIYERLQRYYDGDHDLHFATPKYRQAFGRLFSALSLNICPLVINSKRDRLHVEGFGVQGEETSAQSEDAIIRAREIWRRNRLDKRIKSLFNESLLKDYSYILIWPDSEGRAVWYPHGAASVVCEDDNENIGYFKRAAKAWIERVVESGIEKTYVRLTIYKRDEIIKLRTRVEAKSLPTSSTLSDLSASFVPWPGENEAWPLANVYGAVPIFRLGDGESHLKNILKPQDALNKTICDKMVSMEFGAFRQRWATGLDLPTDPVTGKKYNPFEAGADRLWHTVGENVKFGDFSESDITQFIAVKESFVSDVAMISGIPFYNFKLSGEAPSGEALKVLDKRLADQVANIQVADGMVLADAMRFSLRVEGMPDVDLDTLWRDTRPRNDIEFTTAQINKKAIGISERQLQREAGYTEAEIARMATEREEEQSLAGVAAGRAFFGG